MMSFSIDFWRTAVIADLSFFQYMKMPSQTAWKSINGDFSGFGGLGSLFNTFAYFYPAYYFKYQVHLWTKFRIG